MWLDGAPVALIRHVVQQKFILGFPARSNAFFECRHQFNYWQLRQQRRLDHAETICEVTTVNPTSHERMVSQVGAKTVPSCSC